MSLFRLLDGAARVLGRALLGFLLWFLFIQTVLRLVRRYWHFPAPPFISLFLTSRLRRAMQPPDQVVDRSGIGPGMNVLELGCGPGTFTLEAARRVGSNGRVVAVDIEPRMIQQLREAVDRAGITNVEIRLADAYDLPAADASVDVAFMVGVLAEIPDRQRALTELKRVLKPEGLLSVSEMLVDPDYPWRSTETGWCQEAGFVLEGSYGSFFEYTLTFRPA